MAHTKQSYVEMTDGSTILRVNGPAPSNYELLARTVTGRSSNHIIYSYQLTAKKTRIWPLRFLDLTLSMKTDFVDFFVDTAVGPINTFDYTHTDGTTYENTRFVNDSLKIQRTEPGIFTIEVELEVAEAIT